MTTTAQRIADLLDRGAAAGASLVDTVARSPMLPRPGGCSCEIPPPCWMPRELRETTSCACGGGTAVIRFRVTNRSIQTTEVTIDAVGDDAAAVQITPAKLTLVPLQRGVVTVSLPVDAAGAGERELLLRIHGCVEHVLRWTVHRARRGGDSCHEIDVDDAPDYVHHWYDHFYCARPCGHSRDLAVGVRG